MAEPSAPAGSGVRPVARSPIRPAAPVEVVGGWEVSRRRSEAPLRLRDCAPLAKVAVRAAPDGAAAAALGVPLGHARRDEQGVLVVGSGPGEWLLLGPPAGAGTLVQRAAALLDDRLVTVVDMTHGRALMRLTGVEAAACLAKVCAVDLSDRVTPDGRAFRSSVAKLATDVVRDDRDRVTSYLVHCERSSGQYLHDTLLDAGAEFGVDVDGFDEWTA